MGTEYIGQIKQIADRGKEVYKTKLETILKTEIVELKIILADFVKTHAKESEFGLIVSNDSSSDIKLYEIVDRVKSPESLEEKIIRNQEFFELMHQNDEELIVEIQNCNDDLMGIRFLLSLSCDCARLFLLVKKYEGELRAQNIELLNLEDNPQTMKNGRPIYRIKGKYKTFPFELQIKSKVDSAWADIEHMLFYKDYQFSYIQSTNRKVMNKLGDLLDQVDLLMVQVRESQASYENEKRELEFTQILGSKFRKQTKSIIGSAFILSEYRKILFGVFSKFESAEQQILLTDDTREIGETFNFMHPQDDQSDFVKNYNDLKSKALEFVITEHIYVTWLNKINQQKKIESSEELKIFFQRLITEIFLEKLEYYIKESDERKSFVEWCVDRISSAFDTSEIDFSNGGILFNDAKRLYMIYTYYVATKVARIDLKGTEELVFNEESIDAIIQQIDVNIILRMLDGKESWIDNVNEIIEERDEVGKFITPDFLKTIDTTYLKIEKNSSGKAMPENEINKIIQKILKG